MGGNQKIELGKIPFLKKKRIRIISNHKNHNKNGNPEIWGERESECLDRENSKMIPKKTHASISVRVQLCKTKNVAWTRTDFLSLSHTLLQCLFLIPYSIYRINNHLFTKQRKSTETAKKKSKQTIQFQSEKEKESKEGKETKRRSFLHFLTQVREREKVKLPSDSMGGILQCFLAG